MDAYPAHITARISARRLLKGALAGAAALALAFASIAIAPDAQAAQADPAAAAGTTTISAVGAYSGTVPAGVCTVTATVLGAAGGSPVTTAPNANGAGARVTATYPVVPGLTYGGTVGGGGAGATSGANAGGSNGGGAGGVAVTDHHGGGGGGSTTLNIGGTLAVTAGGGGGAGGGHSTGTNGAGGNAGLPSASGVTNGSTGNVGRDTPLSTVVGGGVGGSATPGAGGVNSADASWNGIAGSGTSGGNGGADPNYDAGGGGGGGYAGAGGGASTVVQNSGTLEIAGAGGGGGSSYISPSIPLGAGTSTPSSISSIAGAKLPAAGNGAAGSVSLVWNSCVYDLAVDKTVTPVNTPINGTVTWTVAVTNNGPSAMTQGDTVTIADSLPGAGAKTITAISVSGGSNAILGRGAVTCTAAVGAAMPASLDCSRPYQIGAGAASGVRGLDVGETLTVTYTQLVTEAVGTTLTNTATVVDRQSGDSNDTDTAATTVVAPPGAVNDSSLGNALGTVVNVPVKNNDTGTLLAGSVVLWNTGTSSVIPSPYVVAGQGTWTVASDIVTFTPLPGFKGDPTPVTYRVTATNGLTATATVTVTYVPVAVNDSLSGVAIGASATVQPLTNDNGDFVNSSLRLIDPSTLLPVTGPVVVAGQGTWTISGTDVVFTPQPGFLTDPSPIGYQITDTTGDVVSATITITSVPSATNDSSLGNAIGSTVNVNVLTNDTGSWNTSSLVFVSGLGTTLVVAGQGTWTVQPGGVIRFVPLPAFKGDPTPVSYRVTDVTGDSVTAQVTVAYIPSAANDSSLGNVMGSDVTVSVLGNDDGDFVAGSVRLMDGVLPVTSLTVPGEGVWTVVGDTVVFDPQSGFLVDPTPVYYRVADTTGDFATATVTVTYLPQAVDDAQGALAIGSVATVAVLGNDNGDWVNSSLRLIDPVTLAVTAGPVAVAGQGTWTISGTNVVFTPLPGFLVDPDPIAYRITDSTGDHATAQVELDYGPGAADDSDLGNVLGSVVDVDVLDNDTGSFDVSSLAFTAGGTTLVVPGEGTWTVQSGGIIRFTPLGSFLGDPAPVGYTVTDVTGDAATAQVTVTYVPDATDDSDLGNTMGADVNVDVLANDTGDFTPGSVRIMNGLLPVLSLTVAGEGTWTVEPDDTITFDPDSGFLTDPTPIHYRVTDTTGDNVSAIVTVTYLPQAADDSDLGNTIGSTVNVPVLANDTGAFVASSVRIVGPGGPVVQLIVPGEGRWVANSDGTVSFFPEVGFLLDPAPVDYRVTDTTGDSVDAQVTVTYVPTVAPDVKSGNLIGAPAVVSVLNNDTGDFDLSTLRIIDPVTHLPVLTVVVPGEGTWTTDTTLGRVTFTPEPGYLGNPTPVTYEITDLSGDVVQALATVTYLPIAEDDESLDNPAGTIVTVPILGNDLGLFDTTTPRLMSYGTPMMSMVVPGEGTWRMHVSTSTVSFEPLPGFLGDPTPVPYRVADVNGNWVTANVTITYLQLPALALTGASVDAPLYGSLTAILMGIVVVLVTRLRRVARHRM